jgi:glycosyltransferase involved in cell wall biosynthesis
MSAKSVQLSIVVPVYNESEGILVFFDLLKSELMKLAIKSYEIIMVNDGSSDDTTKQLDKIVRQHKEVVRVINLTRNFGKEAALSAGLHSSTGDSVLSLDADGQHPPSEIGKFLKTYTEGYDMVVGLRTQNLDEKSLKKVGNKLYYRLLKLSGIAHLQPRVTDFRLMSREVTDEFCRLTERRRITRGLLDWMGFRTAYIEFEAPERLAGTATYSTRKLFYLAVDSILSNSRKPLAMSLALGSFISFMSLFGLFFIAVEDYLLHDPLHLHFSGVAILGLLTLFMVGVLLISQGIASLYLARIYEEAQRRPLYIIDRTRSSPIRTRDNDKG